MFVGVDLMMCEELQFVSSHLCIGPLFCSTIYMMYGEKNCIVLVFFYLTKVA